MDIVDLRDVIENREDDPETYEAWNNALKLARDDVEREGVHIHLARWHRTAGDQARAVFANREALGHYRAALAIWVLRPLALGRRDSGTTEGAVIVEFRPQPDGRGLQLAVSF